MDHLLDWPLINRDEGDMVRLAGLQASLRAQRNAA